MEQAFSSYWWLIFPLAFVIMALFFTFERRGSKIKKVLPEYYIAGLKALIENDENTAFVKLKQAVSDDTDNIDAYLKLGDLFRKRGQVDKAIRIHHELILRKSIAPDAIPAVRKSLVEDYIASKKYALALDVLDKLAKDTMHRQWANEKMRDVYERVGQWEKDYNISKNILKSKDEQKKLAAYNFLLGLDLYNAGEFHKARLAFKDSFHYNEDFAESYIMIAESYLAEGRKRDAVEFYQKLAEKAPAEFYRVVDKFEETMFELGQFSDVDGIYRKILAGRPDDSYILKSLARIAEKKNDIRGAIEYLEQAITAHPRDAAGSVKLLELYLDNDQNIKAEELVRTMKEKYEYQPYIYNCSYCGTKLPSPQFICGNCHRVGPYKRL